MMAAKPLLLLVDDDAAFRTVMAGELSRSGYDVRTAASGEDALAACGQAEPQVILLDLQLPGMSGLDVLKALREGQAPGEVVMLTGHGSIDSAIEAIRIGAFDYVSKPCPLDELEIRIQRALERQALKDRASLLERGLTPPDLGSAFVGESPEFRGVLTGQRDGQLSIAHDALNTPLVVGLHGRGGTAESFAGLFREFAEPRPAFVVPEAPYPLLVQARQPFLAWSWDFPSNDRALWARADPLVASYVLDVARRVKAEKGAGGVYLLGHSHGVAYAYMAMAQDPDLVRGVIAFAGVLPEWLTGGDAFAAAAPRVKVFIAHGRGDEAVAPEKSRRARARLEKLGFDVTYREFKGGHHVDPATLREAHAWLEAIEATRASER